MFITAGSEEKLAACKDLGADVCINYKTEDFVARVKEETGGKGVDVILDSLGQAYFQRNLDSLNFDGRLFLIGTMAAGLRVRSPENKAVIIREVEDHVWPAIVAGKVKPVIYKHFPLSESAEAHQLLESSQHIGKILLFP
ncbi:putative 2-haloacrylate reductase [Rosa chinensis]|uniref:Putative 2-haloacrylate reductase n=1 Tax=Rosa chinensis TaxID=74649 RepID=A0A2P6S319_ROSCH|nr:putative 2-haloacrylate reductase [Rosa chinensis]